MIVLEFIVPGNPVPTARPRVVRTKQGIPVAFTPKPSREYQALVAVHAKRAMAAGVREAFPITDPLRLTVTFHRDSERRCDLDNLLKSVLDGLTKSGVWDDDSQVVELHATKALSRTKPRVEIAMEDAFQTRIP